MPYIPFTEEQKVMANSVDLAEFLRMRGEKLERVGREHKLIYYDSSGKHDSITLRGSTWFDHKNQVGGGAIKFMQEFYDMDFQTAVQELLGQTITPLSHSPPKAIAKEEKKEFRLPEANANMHRVYAYLIKQRFIDPNIISHFAKQHTLYEDKEHHNAVFVGVDENGVPRQAHKRSTNSFGNAFRITCEGSDTRYSFSHFGKSEKLFVFEAPIDMMSFLTLYPKDWQKNSYIAMNGVYENAVLTALKNHSNINEIVLCVDNDEGVSRVPKPGFSGGKRRSASPSSPASRASAVQNSASSAPPPVPSAKHRPMAANVPQPASTAGRNLPGQTHRTATAAPSAHNKQTLRSDSAPKPCSSTPSAAPAAQGAKQSSARPSTRPSPKGISAPYSTAQPPANPRATAPSRRTAGRNTARASSAGAPLRRAFTVKTLVRSVIQNSPLSGGAFWFCSPHCVHIL